MGQYEKDKKELVEKIEQLEHKLKKAKQAGDQADVDKYSRKLADRRLLPHRRLRPERQREPRPAAAPAGPSPAPQARAGHGRHEPGGLPGRRRRRHGHGGDGWFIAVDGVGGPLGPRRAVSDVRVERVPADGVGPPRHRRDVRKLGPV